MQKKVLALHDLSGFGRSSLVPIIAAISAAGHQCVPLPTAYFSTHMAIPGWETVDLTGVMPRVIDQYDRLGLRFESVYAGFLGSADQIDCVRDAVLRLKSENGTAFIDPVMGDNGEVYATYTPEMCTRMRELCEIADIITPNTTEAAILLDRDPASAPQSETEAQEWLHALHSRYGAQVVLTGSGLRAWEGRLRLSVCGWRHHQSAREDRAVLSRHRRPVCGGRARRTAERQGACRCLCARRRVRQGLHCLHRRAAYRPYAWRAI